MQGGDGSEDSQRNNESTGTILPKELPLPSSNFQFEECVFSFDSMYCVFDFYITLVGQQALKCSCQSDI